MGRSRARGADRHERRSHDVDVSGHLGTTFQQDSLADRVAHGHPMVVIRGLVVVGRGSCLSELRSQASGAWKTQQDGITRVFLGQHPVGYLGAT